MALFSPTQAHNDWGIFAPGTNPDDNLPNVAGSLTQSTALQEGDTATVSTLPTTKYYCIDATLGAAQWQVFGTGTGAGQGPYQAVVYVDPIRGNDGTGARGDDNLPFQTVDAALAVTLAGDTVMLGPGSYAPISLNLGPVGGFTIASQAGEGEQCTVLSTSGAPAASLTADRSVIFAGLNLVNTSTGDALFVNSANAVVRLFQTDVSASSGFAVSFDGLAFGARECGTTTVGNNTVDITATRIDIRDTRWNAFGALVNAGGTLNLVGASSFAVNTNVSLNAGATLNVYGGCSFNGPTSLVSDQAVIDCTNSDFDDQFLVTADVNSVASVITFRDCSFNPVARFSSVGTTARQLYSLYGCTAQSVETLTAFVDVEHVGGELVTVPATVFPGSTYYIDKPGPSTSLYYDAVNGNDTWAARGRKDRPFQTMAALSALLQAGDTVHVQGTITEQLIITVPDVVVVGEVAQPRLGITPGAGTLWDMSGQAAAAISFVTSGSLTLKNISFLSDDGTSAIDVPGLTDGVFSEDCSFFATGSGACLSDANENPWRIVRAKGLGQWEFSGPLRLEDVQQDDGGNLDVVLLGSSGYDVTFREADFNNFDAGTFDVSLFVNRCRIGQINTTNCPATHSERIENSVINDWQMAEGTGPFVALDTYFGSINPSGPLPSVLQTVNLFGCTVEALQVNANWFFDLKHTTSVVNTFVMAGGFVTNAAIVDSHDAVAYVDLLAGQDNYGQVGNPLAPFATVGAAMAANPDQLLLGPGVHVVLSTGIGFFGSTPAAIRSRDGKARVEFSLPFGTTAITVSGPPSFVVEGDVELVNVNGGTVLDVANADFYANGSVFEDASFAFPAIQTNNAPNVHREIGTQIRGGSRTILAGNIVRLDATQDASASITSISAADLIIGSGNLGNVTIQSSTAQYLIASGVTVATLNDSGATTPAFYGTCSGTSSFNNPGNVDVRSARFLDIATFTNIGTIFCEGTVFGVEPVFPTIAQAQNAPRTFRKVVNAFGVYDLYPTDAQILADNGGGVVQVQLPDPSTFFGQVSFATLEPPNTPGVDTLQLLQFAGEEIDGVPATYELTTSTQSLCGLILVSDGVNWFFPALRNA